MVVVVVCLFVCLFVVVVCCYVTVYGAALTFTWPHVRYDVSLEEQAYRENCLCYSIVYYYNNAQRYEQTLQVSRLYGAVI